MCVIVDVIAIVDRATGSKCTNINVQPYHAFLAHITLVFGWPPQNFNSTYLALEGPHSVVMMIIRDFTPSWSEVSLVYCDTNEAIQ